MSINRDDVHVTLENDIRDDDAENLVLALTALRGVIKVEPVISSADVHIAEARVRQELGSKLIEVLYPKKGDG